MVKRRRRRRKSILFPVSIMIVFISLLVLGGWYIQLAGEDNGNKVKSMITVEAGSDMIPVEEFLENQEGEGIFVTSPSKEDLEVPGIYPVVIQIGGKTYKSQIEVVDTSPPSNLVKDTTPPVIIGAIDQTVYVGDTISYKKGVEVRDDMDEEVELEIDNSQVNLQKPGEYKTYYIATDASGNITKEEVKITVLEKDSNSVEEEELYTIVDGILDEIIEPSMTDRDKAWSIYQWVVHNISYSGRSDKSDWITGAHIGFTTGTGDCFTYFATTKALLTRADIDNIDVTRLGGKTKHYWHLVNCGDGWYHLDTTPQKDYLQAFMLTDEEVAEYTARSDHNYYTFDESLYPERGK